MNYFESLGTDGKQKQEECNKNDRYIHEVLQIFDSLNNKKTAGPNEIIAELVLFGLLEIDLAKKK